MPSRPHPSSATPGQPPAVTLAVCAVLVAALSATAVTVGNGSPPQPVDAAQGGAVLAYAGGCVQCGVVESVEPAAAQGTWRLQVRMADGSLRTVEQAMALLRGSRVVIEGGRVRPAPDPTARV